MKLICIRILCRCLEKQYQIPILVSETGISDKRRTELEQEIGTILDTKVADGNTGENQQHNTSEDVVF